jgi:hypothetical protein
MENLTEWMLPPSVPSHSFHPDEPVTIVPVPGVQSITVIKPDGSQHPLAPSSITTYADTDALGLYTVVQTIAGRAERSWFTVNLFSDDISRLKPVDRLTLPPSHVVAGQSTHRGLLDLWPWIALFGLGVVLAEWVAFHRGL